MHRRRRVGLLLRLFEEPRSPGAEEGQQRRPAEDIDIREQSRLLHHLAVDEAKGTGAGGRVAYVMAEVTGNGSGLLLKRGAGWPEVGA